MHVSIRQIGNSHGVVIPKPVLPQLGLTAAEGAEMTVEDSALVLRRPANPRAYRLGGGSQEDRRRR